MRAGVSSSAVRQLLGSLPGWWPGLLRRALSWDRYGPFWVPRMVRRLPLLMACWIVSIYAWRQLRGYGGCATHGDTEAAPSVLVRGLDSALPGSRSCPEKLSSTASE
jgi:hypothetical protein